MLDYLDAIRINNVDDCQGIAQVLLDSNGEKVICCAEIMNSHLEKSYYYDRDNIPEFSLRHYLLEALDKESPKYQLAILDTKLKLPHSHKAAIYSIGKVDEQNKNYYSVGMDKKEFINRAIRSGKLDVSMANQIMQAGNTEKLKNVPHMIV